MHGQIGLSHKTLILSLMTFFYLIWFCEELQPAQATFTRLLNRLLVSKIGLL